MHELLSNFKALADENRLKILTLLLSQDLCVGALANRLGISKPAVSQHLQVLRKAGLVKGEKRGYWTHYSVEASALSRIARELDEMATQLLVPKGACFRAAADKDIQEERRDLSMCKDCCEHPERLKGKPEECTPEQIRECHGDVKEHPCETESE
ncbi:MAG: winged helix-turn-helix transcriptional regulator [Deltaproteobacteria bacterium]|nr:winged helix-turn-helix transcriptional regulator [Deltaproteobacteria bacterium]MBW1920481.1 winged helix-turn-helix transcriptional regulator [Deltaproteobacteria bacterium]MBW1935775.1 winged helix-turn-helix transcriptional regulator [Deltaproteobacteria bacterium]MBW1976574.1 winged helix-turn-helix transcriptional regulator [Deltaproteobacteria bacterium]MBW2044954.1 winged helix-turn-helix transcriptional regulator [Deltaproteobacteria bacterium]